MFHASSTIELITASYSLIERIIINGIENFWNQAKRHLRKFNGVPKDHFHLYLKECEWRFNNPKIDMQIRLLKQIVKENLG